MTWPAACLRDGGSSRRSHSAGWERRWPAWTWSTTSPSGRGGTYQRRGWNCLPGTEFARWRCKGTPCPSASRCGPRVWCQVGAGGGNCPRAIIYCNISIICTYLIFVKFHLNFLQLTWNNIFSAEKKNLGWKWPLLLTIFWWQQSVFNNVNHYF